jgi:hypothetical protein
MKSFIALLAVVSFAMFSPAFDAEKSVDLEPLGKIALNQTANDVLSLLAQPKFKGEDTFWEATGEMVQPWKGPALGLDLAMACAKKGTAKTISTIEATAGCKLATARLTERWWQRIRGNPASVSWQVSVYGGILFTQAGEVTKIFIGAAAE